MALDLSIIIPSYLEEENLRFILPRVIKICQDLTPNFEILVIDTQTPLDGTNELCQGFPEVSYRARQNGNDYGDAIRTGLQACQGKYVIFMDADGSHPPHFIRNLYQERQHSDIVIASRYIKGGYTENKFALILMSKMVNLGYSIFLNIKCKDVSNSFKLYPAEQLKQLQLFCSHFDIVEEILYKLLKKNKTLTIKEIPFSFKKRMFGETKRNLPLFILTYFITLIRLRFGK